MSQFDHIPLRAIKWRRSSNGKYLSYFDTKEEAFEYVKSLARRYRASPRWKNSITDLVNESKEKGIILHNKHLGRWFREIFNLTITSTKKKESDKKTATLYIYKDLSKRLMNLVKKGDVSLQMRSWFCNLVLSIHMGIPVPELIVYFDDEIEVEDGIIDKVPVVFYYEGETEIRALNIFAPPKQTQRLIEEWCLVGQEQGIHEIKNRATRQGLHTLGATRHEKF